MNAVCAIPIAAYSCPQSLLRVLANRTRIVANSIVSGVSMLFQL